MNHECYVPLQIWRENSLKYKNIELICRKFEDSDQTTEYVFRPDRFLKIHITPQNLVLFLKVNNESFQVALMNFFRIAIFFPSSVLMVRCLILLRSLGLLFKRIIYYNSAASKKRCEYLVLKFFEKIRYILIYIHNK